MRLARCVHEHGKNLIPYTIYTWYISKVDSALHSPRISPLLNPHLKSRHRREPHMWIGISDYVTVPLFRHLSKVLCTFWEQFALPGTGFTKMNKETYKGDFLQPMAFLDRHDVHKELITIYSVNAETCFYIPKQE